MSKGIRKSLQPSLLASKRFIVSACAAIAMVMGAMSVGASMFEHHEPSDDRQRAEASAIFGPNTHGNPNTMSTDKAQKETTSQLKAQKPISTQQDIGPDNKSNGALLTAPKVIDTLNPLKEIIQLPLLSSKIQIKIDAVPILPDIIPENILPKSPIPIETPLNPEPLPLPTPNPEQPPVDTPPQPIDASSSALSSQSASLSDTE